MSNNRYSKLLTQDETQPAAQAMLYGIGLTEEQMNQPFVGIASMGYDGNTCNMHLNGLAEIIKQAVNNHSMTGISKNRIMPEIRCKIEAIAMGDFALTLITWLNGRLMGRLLFTAGILLEVTLKHQRYWGKQTLCVYINL